jgi:mono/diheme cytochrome c family protein
MPRFPVLVMALLVAGCEAQVAGGAVDGGKVYASACASCHGPAGAPPESMRAQLGVRDLTSAEFRARSSRDLILTQVRLGSKNKLMPSFSGALSDAQMIAVADFVLGLPPAAP